MGGFDQRGCVGFEFRRETFQERRDAFGADLSQGLERSRGSLEGAIAIGPRAHGVVAG